MSRDRRGERLAAWQDGELSHRKARRAARIVADSPEARRSLEVDRAVGDWVREAVAADDAGPDLWPDIVLRLSQEGDRAGSRPARRSRFWLLRPSVAGAAAAAVAAGLMLTLWLQPSPPDEVVQWLDSDGAPLMVLEGPGDTIIWMLNPADEEISWSPNRVAV
jgi:hypothetical protein